jgi:hypothetical protein
MTGSPICLFHASCWLQCPGFTPKPSDQETGYSFEPMLFDPANEIRQILQLALSQAGCRPEYLASLNPQVYPLEALRTNFEIIPEANLYRMLPLESLQSPTTCPAVDAHWAGIPFEQMLQLVMRGR